MNWLLPTIIYLANCLVQKNKSNCKNMLIHIMAKGAISANVTISTNRTIYAINFCFTTHFLAPVFVSKKISWRDWIKDFWKIFKYCLWHTKCQLYNMSDLKQCSSYSTWLLCSWNLWPWIVKIEKNMKYVLLIWIIATTYIAISLVLILSSQTQKYFSYFFFSITTAQSEIIFSFSFSLASRVERPICTKCTSNLLLFGHSSHHVRTPMITFPVEVAMPYPHFSFFHSFWGDAYIFCSAHLVIQGGLRFKTVRTKTPAPLCLSSIKNVQKIGIDFKTSNFALCTSSKL